MAILNSIVLFSTNLLLSVFFTLDKHQAKKIVS